MKGPFPRCGARDACSVVGYVLPVRRCVWCNAMHHASPRGGLAVRASTRRVLARAQSTDLQPLTCIGCMGIHAPPACATCVCSTCNTAARSELSLSSRALAAPPPISHFPGPPVLSIIRRRSGAHRRFVWPGRIGSSLMIRPSSQRTVPCTCTHVQQVHVHARSARVGVCRDTSILPVATAPP